MNKKRIHIISSNDRKPKQLEDKIEIANIRLDADSRQAWVEGKPIRLTGMEFNLIRYLIRNKDRAVSRIELLRNIWGFESLVETRATDDMIKRLRKKLDLAGSQLKITTVWGYGFKLEQAPTFAGMSQGSL